METGNCQTYNAKGAVQVYEAQVDFVTGDLSPVVQSQQKFMFYQARIDAGDTTFQALVEFELEPHAEKDGHGVTDEPGHSQTEQHQTHLPTEENSQEYHECCEYPNNQNSFVENIEHCEPHISG